MKAKHIKYLEKMLLTASKSVIKRHEKAEMHQQIHEILNDIKATKEQVLPEPDGKEMLWINNYTRNKSSLNGNDFGVIIGVESRATKGIYNIVVDTFGQFLGTPQELLHKILTFGQKPDELLEPLLGIITEAEYELINKGQDNPCFKLKVDYVKDESLLPQNLVESTIYLDPKAISSQAIGTPMEGSETTGELEPKDITIWILSSLETDMRYLECQDPCRIDLESLRSVLNNQQPEEIQEEEIKFTEESLHQHYQSFCKEMNDGKEFTSKEKEASFYIGAKLFRDYLLDYISFYKKDEKILNEYSDILSERPALEQEKNVKKSLRSHYETAKDQWVHTELHWQIVLIMFALWMGLGIIDSILYILAFLFLV